MSSVNENVSVLFPDEVLKGKSIEFVTVSPLNENIGVTALSGKLNNIQLLRLFQLLRGVDGKFVPTHEIGVFTFYTKEQLNDFVGRLPEMSAIEILMIMNQNPSLSH